MAIAWLTSKRVNKQRMQGLSTDTKPTLKPENTESTFLCVDTGDIYIWHIDRWYSL